MMIEIGDVEKTRPEGMMPGPLQHKLQWTVLENPMNQRITTLSTVCLARLFHDQKGFCVWYTLTIFAWPNEVLWKKSLAKHYRKHWCFLTKNFDEGVKNRAVHLDFRWKPPSSLGLAIDPELTKFSARDLFKDLTLMPAKIFWDTATVLSEYWDDCKARFSDILMVVVKRL